MTSTTLVVLQPGYLPWLGFFEQLYRSDVFVYYDDVQFDKHGWRNRNRIKSASGMVWLTVPVLHKGLGPQRILDVVIDPRVSWARKHLSSLEQCYARAPYLNRYLPDLAGVLTRAWERLVDLDMAVVDLMCRWLGIERRIVRSSELRIPGERSERLLNLCHHFGATRYLSGSAAQDYLDVRLFSHSGIEVLWQDYQHPIYPQQHGAFLPYLSAIDLLLNCGSESLSILANLTAGDRV